MQRIDIVPQSEVIDPEQLKEKVRLRKALKKDIKAMLEIQETAWLDSYPDEKHDITLTDIQFHFADLPAKIARKQKTYSEFNPNTLALVAEIDKKMIGYILALKEEEQGRISSVYVLPKMQQQGIGTILIEQALIWLSTCSQIILEVPVYNMKAINFYHKQGFQIVSKDTHPFELRSGKVVPCIEMSKENETVEEVA